MINNFFINTKYEEEYNKAKLANDNVSSSSCKNLSNNVINMIDSINSIELSNAWNDSISEVFNNKKNKCLNRLENIVENINNNFAKSEELYVLLFQQLEYLKETDLLYKETYNNMPKLNNYIETITDPKTNQKQTRIKSSYYRDLENWKNTIKELADNCTNMQRQVDEYLSLLDKINQITINSKSDISIPSLVLPEVTNLIDFVDFAELVDKNIISDDYKFDIVVDFEGRKYFAFAQSGYFGDDQLSKLRFAYTDGDGATSISGSACSMCSLLNGLSNMLGIEKVVEAFGLNPSELNYKDNSLNSTLLVGINEKAEQLVDTGDKRVGIETICSKLFKEDVDVELATYSTIDKTTLEKVHDNNAFIIVRLDRNSSDKYKTGGGHYISMIDYDEASGKGLFIDSAVQIDSNDSTVNSLKPDTHSRTRLSWGTLDNNNSKETPLTSVLKWGRGEGYNPEVDKDGYNLIVISKK